MAVLPICYNMCYKDQTLSIPKGMRLNERCFMCKSLASQKVFGSFSPISNDTSRRQHVLCNISDRFTKANARNNRDISQRMVYDRGSMLFQTTTESSFSSTLNNASRRETLCKLCHGPESSSSEKQLRSLDSYFVKLNNDARWPYSRSSSKKVDLFSESDQFRAKTGLGTVDDYLGKLDEGVKSKKHVSFASDDATTEEASFSYKGESGSGREKEINNDAEFENKDVEGGAESSYDESSDLYLIGILASINIAVSLFEIASPIRNYDSELLSLPLLYGAKINHLILMGEWWRLVTPMFLHSGILHVGLGGWVLLTFGPQVCRLYGSFTFFLLYILGGISGNLTSFLHTPEPTVGGTGPVFAIIGAWLIYQIQNRDVTEKEAFESMFQKALIATAISFILSNFGPIDNWTHFGAAFTGIAYGFLTCPMLQMDDASSKSGQEDRITLVRRYADPCKSLIWFSFFILVLSSLLFIIEPLLNSLALDIDNEMMSDI